MGRYREDERHVKVIWEAVSTCGLKSEYQKKTDKHLKAACDAAFISAQYGTSVAVTPELGMVQDFVQAWIEEFSKRAWDVLENGLTIPAVDEPTKIGIVATIFQYLA